MDSPQSKYKKTGTMLEITKKGAKNKIASFIISFSENIVVFGNPV